MISGSNEQLQQQLEYTLLKPNCHSLWDDWPRWVSRQFLTLPIVQTLLLVIFGYSLSSQAVVMRQLRRWKRLLRRSLTRSHKRASMRPLISCCKKCIAAGGNYIEGDYSFLCVLSIKVPIRKKSGNLFNNPCIYIYHHHHIELVARISLTLSRHSSLSFIALVRSSGQHPVSSHSCWMYVRAGRPAFARPCVGIHKSTSLMSSSLLLQCPACLVRDRGQVAVQLVSCGVLLPGLVQDCTQHSCVIAI